MAGNERITIVTTRELPILPFKAPENHLARGLAWNKWLEEIERQFRFFGIESPSDMKDALLIYGGKDLVRLERYLPDADDKLDEYETLKKKLNYYYVPRINKHYKRFLFLKMRPKQGESILSYATRLRERANCCQFHDTCEDRILEHLIQTIDNEALIRKCMKKNWTLPQFLEKAGQFQNIDLQIRNMLGTSERHIRQNICCKSQSRRIKHEWPMCNYCGLSGVHPKGNNCPAYNKQCYRCQKLDHFARVCWSTRYRNIDSNWPGVKHYRGQNNNVVDEREDKRSDRTKNHDDQIAGENVTKSIVTASQKPDRLKQHNEPRLMETEERNSTFSGNKLTREKARLNVECDKQITRIRISDMCAQIKQLKTELKRWKGHCNFLMKSLGKVDVKMCDTKRIINEAHQNQVVVRVPRTI